MELRVTKRKGTLEIVNYEKILKIIKMSCEGLSNVSEYDVLVNSKIKFFDLISTEFIQKTLIDTATSMINLEHPDYSIVAGRLVNFDLRKKVYRKFKPDHLAKVVKRGVSKNLYHEDLYNLYTKEEWDILDSHINHDLDFNYTITAMGVWLDKYLIKDRHSSEYIETPQIACMLVASTMFSEYTDKELRMKQVLNMYKQLSVKHPDSWPTPIMGGLRTAVKQFSSCVLIATGDSLDSINATANSIVKYASQRAGIGIDMTRVRAVGSKVKNGLVLTTGVKPFLKYLAAALRSCSQGALRNTAATVNFQIWHKEIQDILVLKNNKGSVENRVREVDYAIAWNAYLWVRAIKHEPITLFCPNDVKEKHGDLHALFYGKDIEAFVRSYIAYENDPEISKIVIEDGMELLNQFNIERAEVGRIYLFMADEVNRHSVFKDPVTQTNLCVTGDAMVNVIDITDDVNANVSSYIRLDKLYEYIKHNDRYYKVLSYNTETNQSEYKIILGAFDNGMRDDIYEITYNHRTIKVTSNHEIYTQRGWVMAKDLLVTDELLRDHTFASYKVSEKLGTNLQSTDSNIIINKLQSVEHVYDITVADNHNFFANDLLVHNCTEITLRSVPISSPASTDGMIPLCTLAGFNLGKGCEYNTLEEALHELTRVGGIIDISMDSLVRGLDAVLDYQEYPVAAAKEATMHFRPLGVGIINYAYFCAKYDLFNPDNLLICREAINQIGEAMYYYALRTSVQLAVEFGKCPGYNELVYSDGILNIDTYNKNLDEVAAYKLRQDWDTLRSNQMKYGVRNATLLTAMPSETSSIISNATNGIEPPHELIAIKESKGYSAPQIVPEVLLLRDKYKTRFEFKPKEFCEFQLINCAILQRYFCQSLSVNTYLVPREGKIQYDDLMEQMSYAVIYGLKTLYYCLTNKDAAANEIDEMTLSIVDWEALSDVNDTGTGCDGGSCTL